MKKLGLWIRWVTLIGVLGFGAYFFFSSFDFSTSNYAPTQVQKLTVHMNSKYVRNLDRGDDFSLHYGTDGSQIFILVQYTNATQRELMNRVIQAAKEQVLGVGRDQYGLRSLTVSVKTEQVSPPGPQAE